MNNILRSSNEFKKAYSAFKAALPTSPGDWSEAHFERGVKAAIDSAIASYEGNKELARWDLPTKGSEG